MKCSKCGAEWSTSISKKIEKCPFCGEPLMGSIPFQQAIDSFRMIIERFGYEIYLQEKRLYGLINDILPNASKEKSILKTAISLGTPTILVSITNEPQSRINILNKCYSLLKSGGLSESWCAATLFILAMPLGIDPTDIYPLNCENRNIGYNISSVAISYDEKIEKEYSEKANEELVKLANSGDSVAATELGERYYSGTETIKNIDEAIAYFSQAAEMGYVVAEFIMGKLYDEGQSVLHDFNKAFSYYQKAAQKGYHPAQYALGIMYYLGQDCEKNDAEALYWIMQSVEENPDSDAFIILSMIYKDSLDEGIKDDAKAFEYAKKAADMGDANACNLLGTFYEAGCGVKQNYDEALKYYRLAAEKGVENAYLTIGAYYQAGISVPKDDTKAVEFFRYGANVGNMYCLNALGMCYKNGTGVKQDYSKAFELFLNAAYAGNYAGEYNTGVAYDEGQGVTEDKGEAKKWFLLAAEHGSCEAMIALGYYFEKGIPDSEPDLEEAFKWYLKAAETGNNPYIMWVVGNCYSQGLMSAQQDRCTAFYWYMRAAEMGNATAQNNVACDYLKGEIIDLDYQLAIEWFEKAVAQNDMYALNNYGQILLDGDGISRDVDRAFSMIKKSAELGYADAQYNLGVCYFEGWGTSRNLDEALKWFIKANNAGISDAYTYLQKGFKEKNGNWVKRGLFGHVPAPQGLPPETKPIECKGGCHDFCEHANIAKSEKIYDSNLFCYCEYIKGKVFDKKKCPFYKNQFSTLAKLLSDMDSNRKETLDK